MRPTVDDDRRLLTALGVHLGTARWSIGREVPSRDRLQTPTTTTPNTTVQPLGRHIASNSSHLHSVDKRRPITIPASYFCDYRRVHITHLISSLLTSFHPIWTERSHPVPPSSQTARAMTYFVDWLRSTCTAHALMRSDEMMKFVIRTLLQCRRQRKLGLLDRNKNRPKHSF